MDAMDAMRELQAGSEAEKRLSLRAQPDKGSWESRDLDELATFKGIIIMKSQLVKIISINYEGSPSARLDQLLLV